MIPRRTLRAGMLAAPLRFGMIDFKAFGSFVGHTDRVHREVAPDPHYYLLTLGVAAGAHGSGSGGRLVRAMLERADAEKARLSGNLAAGECPDLRALRFQGRQRDRDSQHRPSQLGHAARARRMMRALGARGCRVGDAMSVAPLGLLAKSRAP